MKSFREERAEEKRRNILRISAEIFREKGYQGTTIEEIATRLKLTKGSIYYYVSSKEDLLYQCHEMIAETSIKQLQEIIDSDVSTKEKMINAIKSHIEYICSENSMFHLIERPSEISSPEIQKKIKEQRDRYERLFQNLIEEGVKSKLFIESDPKMMRLLILGALNTMARWYSPTGEKSTDELVDMFTSYIMRLLL